MIVFLFIGVAAFLVLGNTVKTVTQKEQFVKSIKNALRAQNSGLSEKAIHFAAAHACLESGFGKAFATVYASNPWNITQGNWAIERCITQINADLEYLSDGSYKRISQNWRKYSDLNEATQDYLTLLAQNWSAALTALRDEKPTDFVTLLAIKAPKYYTLPITEYVKRYNAVLKEMPNV